jgi:hypothetical protein
VTTFIASLSKCFSKITKEPFSVAFLQFQSSAIGRISGIRIALFLHEKGQIVEERRVFGFDRYKYKLDETIEERYSKETTQMVYQLE